MHINKLELDLSGTTFGFFVSDKGEDVEGISWTDANISIESRYFKYQTGAEFVTYTELKSIHEHLMGLLSDEIAERRVLRFIEPDLEIVLHPRRNFQNDPRHVYVRRRFEITDISADFVFNLSSDTGYTTQYYTLPLYRSDIERLVDFLDDRFDTLDET